MTNQFDTTKMGLVLYADGGNSGSNPGPSGSGIHGYLYTRTDDDKNKQRVPDFHPGLRSYIPKASKFKLLDKELEEYTKEELDTFVTDKEEYKVQVTCYIDQHHEHTYLGETGTNNAAELHGLRMALEQVLKYQPILTVINLDSQYALKGYTEYLDRWNKKGWIGSTGKEVANKEIWLKLMELRDTLASMNLNIHLRWVKGHSKELGNDKADLLAGIGANRTSQLLKSFQTVQTNDPVYTTGNDILTYWKEEESPSVLLTGLKRCYFNPGSDGYNQTYYFGNFGDKQEEYQIGKNVPDSSFAVAKTAQPDPVLECIKRYQKMVFNHHGESEHQLVAAMWDNLSSPKTYTLVRKYLDSLFDVPGYFHMDVKSNIGKDITFTLNPPYLGLRALETLITLEEILNKFINQEYIGEITDVTDIFYEDVYKENKKTKEQVYQGKQLKPEYGVGYSSIKLPLKCIFQDKEYTQEVIINLGKDIPARNTLKNMESLNPHIYMVTSTEDQHLYKYFSIIHLEATNEYAVYSGYQSNVFFTSDFFNNEVRKLTKKVK